MIHHSQLRTIRQTKRWDDFLYPYYERFSIAEIAPSILHLFGIATDRKVLDIEPIVAAKPSTKVVTILIDGFSYHHFIKSHKHLSFFRSLAEHGHVYPITSVFPSTTAAALTTIHTGLTPQEHGLPEWNVYFEEFDDIIETLPFRLWGMEPDGLVERGGSSAMLYEGPTLYETLKAHNIRSYNFLPKVYADSVYSQSVHRGSQLVPYVDIEDFIGKAVELINQETGPAYFFLYWGKIDSVAHHYGPDSREHVEAIHEFSELLQDKFLEKVSNTEDTILILTSDHGHVNIKGEDIINLNKYAVIDKNLMRSPNDKRILPTGSPHDVFLFINPPMVEEVVQFLRDELVGQADVMTIEQGFSKGLFGINRPSAKFLRRIGNVLILPYAHYHVWYEFFPDIPYEMQGIHGGLSEDEMTVPFAIAPLQVLL